MKNYICTIELQAPEEIESVIEYLVEEGLVIAAAESDVTMSVQNIEIKEVE